MIQQKKKQELFVNTKFQYKFNFQFYAHILSTNYITIYTALDKNKTSM